MSTSRVSIEMFSTFLGKCRSQRSTKRANPLSKLFSQIFIAGWTGDRYIADMTADTVNTAYLKNVTYSCLRDNFNRNDEASLNGNNASGGGGKTQSVKFRWRMKIVEKRIDNIGRKRSAIVMEIEIYLRKNKRERERDFSFIIVESLDESLRRDFINIYLYHNIFN